jgi:superfamily II DNA or RNA helicase
MAVYIIRHPDAQNPLLYKIGKANQFERRFSQLSTGYINDIKNPWFIYPTTPEDFNSGRLLFIEKQLHKLFATERVRQDREFFKFDDVANAMSKATAYINSLGIACKLTHDPTEIKTIDTRSYVQQVDRLIKKTIDGKITKIPAMRDYQVEIAHQLAEWHYSQNKAGKIILPPGIGKTYIVAQYITQFKPADVLIITPQIMICDGFAEVLNQYGLNPQVLHSEASDMCQSGIKITTYQTALTLINDDFGYDLVIYDEAHHTCAVEFGKTRNVPAARRLYLTATEKIFDNANVEKTDLIIDMSHESYGPTIARMDIKEAVTAGLLCDYQIYMCDWKISINNMITQLTQNYLRKRLVLYFNTVEAAQNIADILRTSLTTWCIHSGLSSSEKAHIMQQFKSDNSEPMVLCNVSMVGEGVNIPSVDAIVFMEPRMSNIGVIQNIGRGLRISAEKDFCMVLIHPEMIKQSLLLNLEMYDSRVRSPAMYNSTRYASSDLKYSVNGIIELFKLYDSQDFNALQRFITKLREMQIYCATDYMQIEHSEAMPKVPQIVYSTFTWSMVLPRNLVTYDTDTAKKRIAEFMALPNVQDKINACRYIDQKYVEILQLDAAIPYNAVVEALKIKQRR